MNLHSIPVITGRFLSQVPTLATASVDNMIKETYSWANIVPFCQAAINIASH